MFDSNLKYYIPGTKKLMQTSWKPSRITNTGKLLNDQLGLSEVPESFSFAIIAYILIVHNE